MKFAEKYFDNNANCPITSETLNEYVAGSRIGNVSCNTKFAKRGKELINQLKSSMATEFGNANDYTAIITSGGSESNSTVISHYVYTSRLLHGFKPNFISSSVEHPSITDYLERLEEDGVATVTWIKPSFNGGISIQDIEAAIRPDTICVFLQSVNSETGCIQNIAALQLLLQNKSKTLNRFIGLHVDNVQGFRRINYPKNVGDTISLSLHKVGAPLGIGILLTRIKLTPLIAGKQNSGLRGGTYNIGAIEASLGALRRFSYNNPKQYKRYFLTQMARAYNIIEFPQLKMDEFAHVGNGETHIPNERTIILFSDAKCLPHTIFFAIMVNTKILCGLRVKEFMFSEGYTIGTGTACANEATKALEHGSMASADLPGAIKKGFIRISFGCSINENSLKKLSDKFIKMLRYI